jgi:HK97 family phage major capsid protein
MYEIKALREKRAKLHEDAKAILKAAQDEKRELTAEEATKVDAIYGDVDKIKVDVDRLERSAAEEKALAESAGRKTESRIVPPDQLTRADWNRMFRAWASYGSRAANSDDIAFARKVGLNPASQELDVRALTVTTATQGGNTVADEPMRSYYEVQKWYGAVRNLAQVITTETGGDLPVPTMNDTSNTGELVADSGAHTTTADPSIGQVVMKAYKYGSKAVLVSVELLQDASFDLAAYLGKALGTRVARIKNTHFTTGDNSGKPQGFTVGGSSGKTASATNAYTWSEINDLMHSVDPAYRQAPGMAFMCHDTQIGYIRKMNFGSTTLPIWEPSTQLGEPDRIFSYPVIPNNDMSAAVTTGIKVLAFGNFQTYMIREVGSPVFVRLNELYALNGQVAFLAFERADGRCLDATAIKWLNLA